MICNSGKSSLKNHKLLIASDDTCISSRNNNVFPAMIGVLYINPIFEANSLTSVVCLN